jgi:hypothetical protein
MDAPRFPHYSHVRSNAPHFRDIRQNSIRASTMESFLIIREKKSDGYAVRNILR